LQADRAILADLSRAGVEIAQLEERQYLKQLEDALDEAISILDHTLNTAETVRDSITCLRKTVNSISSHENQPILDYGFREVTMSLNHYLKQAKTLKNKVQSASDLVTDFL